MIIRTTCRVPRKHLPSPPIRIAECQILSSYLGARTPGAAKLRNRIAKLRCDPIHHPPPPPPPPNQPPPPPPPFWPLFNNNPCQHFLAKITRVHLPVPSSRLHHSRGRRRPGPGRSACTFLNGNLGYSGQQRPMPNIHKVCLE